MLKNNTITEMPLDTPGFYSNVCAKHPESEMKSISNEVHTSTHLISAYLLFPELSTVKNGAKLIWRMSILIQTVRSTFLSSTACITLHEQGVSVQGLSFQSQHSPQVFTRLVILRWVAYIVKVYQS